MKKFSSIPFIVCILFLTSVHSQKNNYVDGFLITLQSDTIACSIQKRNWKKQPSEIHVKSPAKDSAIAPQSIKGFIVPFLQVEYVTKAIRPARFIDKAQNANSSKDPDLDTLQFAFLKMLHRGTFNLYTFIDRLGRNHFFVEAPDNFLEIYTHYYLYLGDSRRIYDVPVTVLDKQFEFVLKVLMTSCRAIFGIIENIQLNMENLKGLFEVYDKCMASKKEE